MTDFENSVDGLLQEIKNHEGFNIIIEFDFIVHHLYCKMQKDNYTYGYDVEINALKKHYKTPDPICHFNGATRFKKVDLTKGLPPGLTIDSYKRAAFIEGAYLAVCLVRDAEKAHGNPIEIILKERI